MNSDFCPLTLTDEEIHLLKNLRRLSDETGVEYGQLRNKYGFSNPYTSHDKNSVAVHFDPQDESFVCLYHSHINETLFSRQDYSLLIAHNVARISVITSNCEVFSVYIGDGYRPGEEEYWDVVADIHSEVVFDMANRYGFLDLDPNQMTAMTYREMAFRIARHFKWTLEGGTP